MTLCPITTASAPRTLIFEDIPKSHTPGTTLGHKIDPVGESALPPRSVRVTNKPLLRPYLRTQAHRCLPVAAMEKGELGRFS